MPEVDLLIIGAGPTGLYAAYYAGFRGLSVAVVDSLPELGGQITAMYPEKAILDVAGFPTIKGRDLVEGLVAQAATADPQYFLDRTLTNEEWAEAESHLGDCDYCRRRYRFEETLRRYVKLSAVERMPPGLMVKLEELRGLDATA